MSDTKSETASRSKWIDPILWHLDMAFWGICGALARTGLNKLTDFEFWGPLWANVAGCVVMGFQERFIHESYRPMIGVGFCGSLTSFSSLIVTLFNYSTTPTVGWRTYGYGVMAFISYLVIELGCSISAYFFGKHLERAVRHYHMVPTFNTNVLRYIFAIAGIAAWIAVLVISITVSHDRSWPLTGVFAPIGVYGRYYASKMNRPTLKIGTFFVNMVGTILACIFTILQHPDIGANILQINVLQALIDGLCGNFTTVSSLVVELTTLPLRRAYLYGVISFALAFCFAVLIIGSFNWTR